MQGTQKEVADAVETAPTITVSVVSSISLVPAEEWDACAMDTTGGEAANPFILHAFLLSLEESKSASPVLPVPLEGSSYKIRMCYSRFNHPGGLNPGVMLTEIWF